MPDYRISQAQLLRLALLASGGDSPKFDEVFGIIREAKPILDSDTVKSLKSAEFTGSLGVAQPKAPQTLEEARRKAFESVFPKPGTTLLGGESSTGMTGAAPLPPVTGDEPNVTGTADDATPPAKPE